MRYVIHMTDRKSKVSTRLTFERMLLPYEYIWKVDVNASKKFSYDSGDSKPRERDCHTVELSKQEPKEFIMRKTDPSRR